MDASSHVATTDVAAPRPSTSPQQNAQRGFLALACLAAAATVATFAYAAWLLILNGGTSNSFGWTEAPRRGDWYIVTVAASGPAGGRLEPGDRLISVNGVPPVKIGGTAFHRRSLTVGDMYDATIERNGELQQHRLTVAAGPNLIAQRLTYFGISLVWCAVGLFIGFARPDKPLARLGCTTAFAVGMVFLQVGVIRSGPIWQPLHVVLGFHFFARFPADRPTRGIWRIALVATYVTAAASALVRMSAHAVLLTSGVATVQELIDRYWSVVRFEEPANLFYPLAVVGMVLAVPWNYRRLTDEDSRRRVRWVVYISGVALVPQFWWAAVDLYERTIGPTSVSKFDLTVNAFTVLVPISIADAVVRHRMFDIKVVVRRGLQYLLARRAVQAVTAVPTIALAYTAYRNRQLTIGELVTDTQAYLYWLVVAGVVLTYRRGIELWLDRRFFREEHDREQLLLALVDDVATVESLADLSRFVNDKLTSTFHPTNAFVWYRDPDDLASASSSNPQLTPIDVPSSERWLAWLERQGSAAMFPVPNDSGLSADELGWFTSRGIQLVVPMTDSRDQLVGALLLGEKKSEDPYTETDRRLLTAIARQAAVVRETLRLRARVGEEIRIRHDVLARLDGRVANLLKECPACGACYDSAERWCPDDGTSLALSLPVARTIDDRYRLDRLIGKGGMGAVYEARDLRLGRVVAVKIMLGRAFGQQAALRRFHREARAAGRLNHPNIVRVYDFGVLQGEGAYFVMERVHGITLWTEIDRRRALPPPAVAEWFDPLLEGVAAAHAQGVIHRDLKPENVIGERTGADPLAVKILDLGLAKFREEEPGASATITAEGAVMGTIGYMSPEQLLGREVDQRTDIYAVGVMLVESLTGQTPWRTGARAEQALRISPASYELPGVSSEARDLSRVLQRCLALDVQDRCSSAEALRLELIPLLRDCPPLDVHSSAAV